MFNLSHKGYICSARGSKDSSESGIVRFQLIKLLLELSFFDELVSKCALHVSFRDFREKDYRGHEIVIGDIEAHRNFDRSNGESQASSECGSNLNSFESH